MRPRHLMIAAALSSTQTACIALEIDVPEVCVRRDDVMLLAGTPEAANMPEAEVSRSYDLDGLGLVTEVLGAETDAIALLHAIRLIAPEDGDMSFVRDAYARLESERLPAIILECTDGCGMAGNTIELTPKSDTNLADYLTTDAVHVEVGIRGRLPAATTPIDVDICLMAQVSLHRDP